MIPSLWVSQFADAVDWFASHALVFPWLPFVCIGVLGFVVSLVFSLVKS